MAILPDIAISQQTNKTTEARILETKFGGGYRQRAQDGINAIKSLNQYPFLFFGF